VNNLKPYKKYKPSNIAWLGDIPEHWEVSRLKYLTNKIVDGTHFTPTYVENGVPFLRVTDIQTKKINLSSIKYIPLEEHNELIKRCKPEKGDVLLSKNGTIGITKIIDWDFDFSIFVSLCLIKLKPTLNPYFFSTLFSSKAVEVQIKEGGQTTSVTNLHLEKIRELICILPPLKEQLAIANFLDYKLSKIDRFIQKKKQLIKLLNEQKAGIINDAVTKGLNPNAKMKPSDIEWLGDIPEHWEVRKLKFIVTLNDETLSEKTNANYELRYIDIGNVDETGKVAEIVTYKFSDAPSRAKRIVKEGDVIISTVRTYLKAITQITHDCKDLIVSTGFAVLRPSLVINSHFLNFVVRATYFIQRVCSDSFGVSYPAINASDLVNFEITFPPLSEQKSIVQHIQQETAQINTIIQTIEKEIVLTQEYRVALIAEAVTGKIDVRDYKIPETPIVELYEELEDEMSLVAEEEVGYLTEN